MFDRVTAAEIAKAPALTGVDQSRLAPSLTDAFVQVSVAKALLEGDLRDVDSELLTKLASIARSQEAIALMADDEETRVSAAYVAARAYQVVALGSAHPDTAFTATSIPTLVSAMLLFAASDSGPDAEEMAQHLNPNESGLGASLAVALIALCKSDFRTVAELETPKFQLPHSSDPHEIAAYLGYFECLVELSNMCAALLKRDREGWRPGGFARIRDSLMDSFSVDGRSRQIEADDTILGPWHLASLLVLAEEVLVSSVVTSVAVPSGVSEREWSQILEGIARRRPTLWRNHRDAVRKGFLTPGNSAVVTFPTGAGKSTVTELKVASVNLSGRSVIVLVPTLSLLDQQAHALRSTLKNARIIAPRGVEDEIQLDSASGAAIFVMTPESCLALFSSDPDVFGDVGLIAFDEAHLLSATTDIPSRRSLDATLCLLLLSEAHPGADVFLVSAMIGNPGVLSGWLADMTGREALVLDDPWKPTRQARGAVLYRAEELAALESLIYAAQARPTTDGPPTSLQRRMSAVPHGFFGLLTTWESTSTRDYRMLPLLHEPAPLRVSGKISRGGWRLTGNFNKTAAAIAEAGAQSGCKVLVFAQQVGWSASISKEINRESSRITELKRSEIVLLKRAKEAAGGLDVLYGEFDESCVLGDSLPHHGLLLPEERRLHESVYGRADGLPVLVATSTLAQGMNLPSEIVIIAGDRRFDTESNRPQRLEAQELLNAAGRAGRAGLKSNGLVIVIPSYPIGFDGASKMGAPWFDLQSVFSQADQCVDVVDPIASLLASETTEESAPELEYLSRRLAESADPKVTLGIYRRSLGAFVSRREGTEAELEARLARTFVALDPDVPPWARRVVAATGLAVDDVLELGRQIDDSVPVSAGITELREWAVGGDVPLSGGVSQQRAGSASVIMPQRVRGSRPPLFRR